MTTYATQTTINDIPPLTHITSGSSQTIFNTNWTADADTDIAVFVTPQGDAPDDATQIIDPMNYVVTFVGGSQTVRVTFNDPQTLGDLITITRHTPASRLNLYTNTNFLPSMLNQDVGILTLVDQQAQLVNQYVAPRYNYTAQPVEVVDTILPVLGANQVWVKNSGNTAIIAADIPSVFSGVSPGTAGQIAYYATDGAVVSGANLVAGAGISISLVGNDFTISQTGGAGVISLTGTENQVLVNGTSGTPQSGIVTLTLPQSIAPTSNVQFNSLQLSNAGLLDANANTILGLSATASAVNYLTILNNSTGNAPEFQATGTDTNVAITLRSKGTSGINLKGVSTNSSVSAGYVGEYVSSSISGSPVSISTNTSTDLTSISLTAGDWDVWGNINFLSDTNTVVKSVNGWISSTSATLPATGTTIARQDYGSTGIVNILSGGVQCGMAIAPQRFSLASTTTIYISGYAIFTTSTLTMTGFIAARRRT